MSSPPIRTNLAREPREPRVPRLALIALAALMSLIAPACDNPACVFGPGNCQGGGGVGVGENPATQPQNGVWIELAAPTIFDAFPRATQAAELTTPIVIVFSESMTTSNLGTVPPTGLGTAFELQSSVGQVIPLPVASLLGDGRLLVLFPPLDLVADTTYDIVLKDTAKLADLTGQTLVVPANGLVGSFTTVAVQTNRPKVVAVWPGQNATNESATTEIDVIFDHKIDGATVDNDSFEVLVDGAPPIPDPSPTPLLLGGVVTETRVYRWKSVDSSGVAVPLGEDVHVELKLSGTGHVILDDSGGALAAITFSFDTAPFSAPFEAAITSDPHDAIGIDQISGPMNLAIEVQLTGAAAGDKLVLTMFGKSPVVVVDPPLIALRREVEITSPFDSFTMTAEEVDLLASSNPVRGRLADGPVTMAFQLRHGNASSPVRLLDVEPTQPGTQDPTLDTVPPTLTGLSPSGTVVASFRSDQRDLVLVGQASEQLARALVTTPLGDNSIVPGTAPPVVGSQADGLFVAAPVHVGVVTVPNLPIDYGLTIYDHALNSATIQSDVGDPNDGFLQVGASGPGNALPGGTVSVEVYDATTLAPVGSANVHVAENLNGTVVVVTGGLATTDVRGFASVPAAPTGQTILTVEKPGYDVFTFEDVPTGRLGVPLTPSALAAAEANGTFGPTSQSVVIQLNSYTRAVADTRRPETDPIFSAVSPCTFDANDSRFECPFGPIAVRSRRIGAQSAITVLVPPTVFLYSALTFLKTAEIFLPTVPVDPGGDGESHLPIENLLDEGTLDPEDRPVDAPVQILSTAAWPVLASDPVVAVEATSPGIPAAVVVGRGVAFDDALPPDTWAIRAAYPGSVDGIQDVPADLLGRLVTQGTVGPDLLLRVEVADPAGNHGGARPRFSVASGGMTVPAPPVLPANPATVNAGGLAFDLTFPDVLPDALSPAGKGLYRVELTDALGRRWTIFRPDGTDAQGPDVVFHVPDLAGVFPLAAGPLSARISAWSWPGLDLSEFLWSDIEREHDLFVHSIAQTFTPP